MNLKYLFPAASMLLGTAFTLQAAAHEPFDRSRIYWDMSTQVDAMPWGGNYGRMVQLLDGRLMIVGSYGGGLSYTISTDYGATWSPPTLIIRHPAGFHYGSPDFTQLADGTLLVGLNPRPSEPYSEERKFGIRVLRSTDLGQTWSEPIFVFDAEYYGADGCWEPSFLQLPSGEVQCYYSVELKNSGDQEIKISRSFDNGLTWGPSERVCYRAGWRDGMATAIVTDAGEIVGIIEDFGHESCWGSPRATTFRCSLEDNWKTWVNAGSPNREMIFAGAEDKKHNSAAPYIRKLPNGETMASWMGNHDGRTTTEIDRYPLFVAVGDADARKFKCTSAPFHRNENEFANWGSIAYADDGYVYAMANYGSYGGGCTLALVKGRPRKGFEAPFGTPVLDASPSKDAWTYPRGRQLTMGTQSGNKCELDFLYDNDNFYIYAYGADRDIRPDEKIDKDGYFIWLDVAGCCDVYPQQGMYKFFFGVDGKATLRRGLNKKWQPEEDVTAEVQMVHNVGRTYYIMEIAIPWRLLGEAVAPGPDRAMRINVMKRDLETGGLNNESIPEATDRSSWTWPELTLGVNTGIDAPADDASRQAARFIINGTTATVEATRPVASLSAVNLAGALVATSSTCDITLPSKGVFIISVKYADGNAEHRKIAL